MRNKYRDRDMWCLPLTVTCERAGLYMCTHPHKHLHVPHTHKHTHKHACTHFHETVCKGKYNSRGKLSKTSSEVTKQKEQLVMSTRTSIHVILQSWEWLCIPLEIPGQVYLDALAPTTVQQATEAIWKQGWASPTLTKAGGTHLH